MGLLSLGLRAQPSLFLAASSQPASRIWAFPGQGSHRVGMGQDLYQSSSTYREVFDSAHEALQQAEGVDLRGLVFSQAEDQKAAQLELTRTLYAQPALLASNVAYLEHLKRVEGISLADHDLMAGHSLGEWAAYVAAGALTVEQGVLAVYWRGRFMEEAFAFDPKNPPMMAILGLDTGIIESVCAGCSREGHVVVPANYNDPGQLVISGHPAAVKEAADQLAQQGARTSPLKAAGPFHTPLMEEVKEKLTAKLVELGIKISHPKQTIISNVTAQAIAADGDHLTSLMNQITGSVLWHESMLEASRLGALQFVSVDVAGLTKQSVLIGMANDIFSREAPVQTVDLRVPLQRRALRYPPDMIRVTSFPSDPNKAEERLLRYSYHAAAVALEVKKLVELGSDEAIRRALIVAQNRHYVTRDAGLRQLKIIAEHPAVQETMAEYGLEWPEPETRDLDQVEVPEETQRELADLLVSLQERGMSPVEASDLTYYVATRWEGNHETLKKILDSIKLVATRALKRLALMNYTVNSEQRKGIASWEDVVLFLDFRIGSSYAGAFKKEDL